MTVDHEHHGAGVHHSTDTDCKCSLGHEVYIAFEEAAVCDDSVGSECFLTCSRGEGRTLPIESDVAVGSYATHKEIDAAVAFDFVFETLAFGFEVGSVAVEDVHVLAGYVDVAEEVVPHEAVIAFEVFSGRPTYSSMLKVTTLRKDTFPSLYNSMSRRYIPKGELPVGHPRTNGCSAVGLAAFILAAT